MKASVVTRRPQMGLMESAVTAVMGLLALLVGLVAVAESLRYLFIPSDTGVLLNTADQALAHLRNGQLTGWNGAYPLLQAIPAAVLRAAGLDRPRTIDGLVALNLVSFAALALISWLGLRGRSASGAVFLLVVLLSSPMLWYMHASFGEPLAALFTLAAVVACLQSRGHLAAAVLLFFAGVSKDTAVPFLLVLCLGASIGNRHWSEAPWRWIRVATLVVAGAVSFGAVCAYNYARFGSILDVPYTDPSEYVPWLKTQADFFAAIWVAPNGGLLLFWPSFGVLLVLALVAVQRAAAGCSGWRARAYRLAPALAVIGLLFGMTLELSKWWSPLGWSAWGPRLLLPWVPASAYLLVAVYSAECERLLAWLVRPAWRFWLAAIALAVVSFPQYVAMMRPALTTDVYLPDSVCPTVAIVQTTPGYYYHCINHQMWTEGSALLKAFVPGAQPVPFVIGTACAVALLWLLYQLRRLLVSGAYA